MLDQYRGRGGAYLVTGQAFMPLATDTPIRVLKQDAEQRYTLGIVYEPDKTDAHGDRATAEEIEKACWDFSCKMQGQRGNDVVKTATAVVSALLQGEEVRVDVTPLVDAVSKGLVGDQHEQDAPGVIVENYIARTAGVINGIGYPAGTWLQGHVWSPEYFEKIKNGERTGLSLGGRAIRVPRVIRAGETD